MKVLALLFFLGTNLYAAEFSNSWSDTFEKTVTMSCFEEDTTCEEFCGDKETCEVKEKVCRDCIGTSVTMTYIFNYMGLNLVNTGKEISTYEITDLLESGLFVTLTSKSIYNHVDSHNSLRLRRKFRSLCENRARMPVVFFDSDPVTKKIGKVRFVACDDEFYEMADDPDIVIEESNDLN